MTARGPDRPVERWFDGHGIRIHALDWGGPEAGTPVVLLHGVGGNARIWDDVARRLREALPDHRVIALDGRDGGDTEHPAEGYGREDFVGDVLAVHDALGDAPMVLVGHSRSGWIAAWLASQHPKRVARLVLVDPARLVFASNDEASGFFDWVRESLGPFASEEAAVAWAQSHDRRAAWTPVRTASFLAGFRRLPDGRLVGKLPLEAVPQLRRAREGGETVTAALGAITAPTLVFVAERQSSARIADKVAYVERIPGARELRLDGSHFLHTDLPEAVAREIAAFVRE